MARIPRAYAEPSTAGGWGDQQIFVVSVIGVVAVLAVTACVVAEIRLSIKTKKWLAEVNKAVTESVVLQQRITFLTGELRRRDQYISRHILQQRNGPYQAGPPIAPQAAPQAAPQPAPQPAPPAAPPASPPNVAESHRPGQSLYDELTANRYGPIRAIYDAEDITDADSDGDDDERWWRFSGFSQGSIQSARTAVVVDEGDIAMVPVRSRHGTENREVADGFDDVELVGDSQAQGRRGEETPRQQAQAQDAHSPARYWNPPEAVHSRQHDQPSWPLPSPGGTL
ncbi:hypothetical protein N656DRAFT_798955 [Canariomyces notabilis]|uniref:Uncharacterized protein n=1 Tax=Canariomyces notabilis TaxID=2074819 RepID=A0AAN6TBZ3_9PEZI|nr:hypothetical protein N656DRAFT_798955 [Canariomyces arenarius]